LELMLRKGSE
jgi:hypothetical protein